MAVRGLRVSCSQSGFWQQGIMVSGVTPPCRTKATAPGWQYLWLDS
jgi:hypothetical protein